MCRPAPAPAAYLETEKHFRRIMGYKSLWMLVADAAEPQAALRKEKAARRHEETEEAERDQSKPTRLLQAAVA